MAIQACSIRIQHQIIRHHHVLTSPDVPNLYVASLDEPTARRSVQAALDLLERAQARRLQGGISIIHPLASADRPSQH